MNTTAKTLTIFTSLFLLSACRLSGPEEGSQNRLSSVVIGEFKPEGSPAWKSGLIEFIKVTESTPVIKRDFTSANSSLDAKVPSGFDYEVSLKYFEDEAATKLLYKACADEMGKPIKHKIDGPSVSLEIEICDANGNVIGATSGVSNVSVKPVIKKAGGAGTGSTTQGTSQTNPNSNPTPNGQTSAAGDAAKGAKLLADPNNKCMMCHSADGPGPILDKSKATDAILTKAATEVGLHSDPIKNTISQNKADILAALSLK